MISDTSFAAMVRKSDTLPRPTTADTKGKTRGEVGRPTTPREPLTLWRIALRVAMGEKFELIASDEGMTTGMVSKVARAFGLPPRAAPRTGKPDVKAKEILRTHAVLLSEHSHRQAQRWAAAANEAS